MADLALHPPTSVDIATHAWARISEMKLTLADVVEAVTAPDHDRAHSKLQSRRLATKGGVTAVYSEVGGGRKLIHTVVKAGKEHSYGWHHDTPEQIEAPADTEQLRTMNDILLEKLKLWGCHEGRRSSDFVHILFPGGAKLRVRPAEHLMETTSATADRIYELLGVTPEAFWSRTTKVRLPRERIHVPRSGQRVDPKPAEVTHLFGSNPPDPVERLRAFRDAGPRKRGRPPKGTVTYAAALLDFFEQRPGAPFGVDALADAVGIGRGAVLSTCSTLHRQGRIERVGRGRYQLADEWDATDRRLAEINSELANAGDVLRRMDLIEERALLLRGSPTDVGSEPSTSVGTADLDDEIDSIIDLIAPGGVPDHLSGQAAQCRDAIRSFITQLRD